MLTSKAMYAFVDGGWGWGYWAGGWVDFSERDRPWRKKEQCFRRSRRTLVHGFSKQAIALAAVIWELDHCHVPGR